MSGAAAKARGNPRVVLDEGAGSVFPLILEETLVGRIDSAHLVFEDGSVSRLHARLRLVDGEVVVEDLGSSAGTWVNGEAVASRRLAEGDRVAFGDVVVVFGFDPAG